MADAQRVQPSSVAWLVIIDSSHPHPAAPATRTNGSRTRRPSLVRGGDTEEATSGPRTMIHLELTEPVGRDVSAFSLYPQECEVLLPPNVCFKVVSRYNAGSGLVMVQCRLAIGKGIHTFLVWSMQV